MEGLRNVIAKRKDVGMSRRDVEDIVGKVVDGVYGEE